MRSAWVVLVLCACSGGSGSGSDAPDAGTVEPAQWHTARGHLRDAEGRAVVLRGVNLASAHKKAPYFGFHTEQDFQRIRTEWGMNAVRLLVPWAAVEPREGEIDDAYLDALAQRVTWAADSGLLVILDMHQDLYGEGFNGDGAPRWTCDEAEYVAFEPTQPWYLNYLNEHVTRCFDGFWMKPALRAHYVNAWRALATKFANQPAVIGFDVINEPFWGSTPYLEFEETVLGPFYEAVVPAVRELAPSWVAFLEPSSSRNLGIQTRLPAFTFPSVVYAPHSYDDQAEAGGAFDPARRDAIMAGLALMRTEASFLDAALWIGEYGGNADKAGIVEYMDAQYDGAAAVFASSMYWAYDRDNGYGLLRPDGSEKTLLVDALVRPYPFRVAGDPIAFSYDEATRVFSVHYKPLERITAPTEIIVPERAYPAGYVVECGGCAAEKLPGMVRIPHAATSATEVEVVIRPVP